MLIVTKKENAHKLFKDVKPGEVFYLNDPPSFNGTYFLKVGKNYNLDCGEVEVVNLKSSYLGKLSDSIIIDMKVPNCVVVDAVLNIGS